MIEFKGQKTGKALYFYCKDRKYCDYVTPSTTAMDMVIFLLKHPKLLQEPKYKHLYENLLEFQIDDAYLSFLDFDNEWGNSLDRDTLKNAILMANDTELQYSRSKACELKLSDIDEFILNYFY